METTKYVSDFTTRILPKSGRRRGGGWTGSCRRHETVRQSPRTADWQADLSASPDDRRWQVCRFAEGAEEHRRRTDRALLGDWLQGVRQPRGHAVEETDD